MLSQVYYPFILRHLPSERDTDMRSHRDVGQIISQNPSKSSNQNPASVQVARPISDDNRNLLIIGGISRYIDDQGLFVIKINSIG